MSSLAYTSSSLTKNIIYHVNAGTDDINEILEGSPRTY